MSQRSSITLPPINSNDFRSARKSVPISHTPKIASSGIVVEEDAQIEKAELRESKSVSVVGGAGGAAAEDEKVLPEINNSLAAASNGVADDDEVLQGQVLPAADAATRKKEQQRGSTLSSPPGATKQLL